jgi:diguanylate cyclase (GGDEF)-like protein
MRTVSFVRSALIATLLLLAFGLAGTPLLIQSSQDAIRGATRHDVAWIGVNGREEFHELKVALLELAAEQRPAGLERVHLTFAITLARLETWSNGTFQRVVLQLPDGPQMLEHIGQRLGELEVIIARLPEPSALSQALALTRQIEADVNKLSRNAFTFSNEETIANRKTLEDLQRLQRTIMLVLGVGGLLLVGLLIRHNLLLARAYRHAEVVAAEKAFLASHDPLTKLANRTSFHASLGDALLRMTPHRRPAVLMIDLDGFKPINDVLGHKAGDALLASVADRLRLAVESVDGALAARLGGDEFAVILPDCAEIGQALSFANALLKSLHQSHEVVGHRVGIDASIGIALHDGSDLTTAELLNRADMALVSAKGAGKGLAMVYEQGMGEAILHRKRLESDMAEADFAAEFVPFYQPIVDLQTRRIVAVEALARWFHPVRGMVSPADFIPVAESSGRIIEIGWVILEKACRDALTFPAGIVVSVNVSAVQLMRNDVHLRIGEILALTGLPAHRLKVEVTESVLINDARTARAALEALQKIGVAISLDDFGTGFSSLSYLSGFGFNELKIDRQFTQGMAHDPRGLAITQTIIALARTLEMTTVGEGVETQEQVDLLKALGCARGQGYLFGKPQPAEQMRRALYPSDNLRAVA